MVACERLGDVVYGNSIPLDMVKSDGNDRRPTPECVAPLTLSLSELGSQDVRERNTSSDWMTREVWPDCALKKGVGEIKRTSAVK